MLQITPDILALIDRALEEDLVYHDPTTGYLIPPSEGGKALVVSKAQGVLAGIDVACAVFQRVDPTIKTHKLLEDGMALAPGDKITEVSGPLNSILRAERTALNFVQRMSGIATLTSRYVNAVKETNAQILDTRKTVPGFRYLDKYSVRMGGGHIAALKTKGFSLTESVRLALAGAPHTLKVEVEVESIEQARQALEGGAHILMLDNMSLTDMKEAAALAKGKALTEASGGINLDTVLAAAETGVDLISVGALTHSVEALDLSLDFET
jgi:nicotinate-nucleotide pyrophosphorylase (carboxylating)